MYQHPGVYIEHVPSGQLSIEAASTSVAALIGWVKRGDLVTADKGQGAPVFISSVSQFTRLFGELKGGNGGIRDMGGSPDEFGFAVNAFFANGGSKAYIVPVGKAGGKEALAAFAVPGNNLKAFYFNAKSEGTWANDLVVELTPDVEIDTAGKLDFALSTFKVAFGLLNAKGILNPVFEQFTGLSLDPASPQSIVSKINAGSELAEANYEVIASNTGGETLALLSPSLASINLATALAGAPTIDVKIDGTTTVTVALAGAKSWQDVASKIQKEVTSVPAPGRTGFVAQVTADARLLLISGSIGPNSKVVVLGGPTAAKLGLDPTAFYGKTPPVSTTFPLDLTGMKIGVQLGTATQIDVDFNASFASLAAIATKIQTVVTTTTTANGGDTAFVADASTGALVFRVTGKDESSAVSVKVPGTGTDCRAALGLDDAAGAAFRPTALAYPQKFDDANNRARATFAGGSDWTEPKETEYTAAFLRLRDYRDVSIMLLPGRKYKTSDDKAIIDSAITHAEFMQNRMVIVDPPKPVSTDKLESPTQVSALGAPTSPYTALYYPWLEVVNPFYDKDTAPGKPKTFTVPPSAFAAGMWARIDNSRGVWKAPAGLEATVRGSVGPTVLIGNDLQDNLNEWGVNCLRAIIGPTVIWGARTLATKSKPEFRYIPVRRTQSMIGESLYNALQAVVFEPNDHKLWSSLRASVSTFMDGLFRSGAFQGAKASEAFYVLCGLGSTMTQGDIDAGIVRVVVGFAPLKPAEFVVVQIQQIVGQAA